MVGSNPGYLLKSFLLYPLPTSSFQLVKERPLARKGVQNHLSNKCKQIINSPMGGSSSLQYTIHTFRVDMVVTIHDDLLTQCRHIPMGQFRTNIFLIPPTSNYLWASEVFKNQSLKNQLFSSSLKKNYLKLKSWLNFNAIVVFYK